MVQTKEILRRSMPMTEELESASGQSSDDMAKAGHAVKGIAHVSTGLGVGLLASFLNSIILANYLGASGLGLYSISVKLVDMLLIFAGLGAPTAVTYLVASSDKDERASRVVSALGLYLIVAIVTSISIAVLLFFKPFGFEQNRLTFLIWINLTIIPLSLTAQATSNASRGRGQYKAYSLVVAVSPCFSLAWNGLITQFDILTPEKAIIGLIIGNLLGAVIGIATTKDLLTEGVLDTSDAARTLRLGIPLAVVGFLVTAMDSIGVLLLGIFTGDTQAVGIYTNAHNLTVYLRYVVEPIGMVILPPLTYLISQGKRDEARTAFSRTLRLIIMALVPMCSLVLVFPKEILLLVFVDTYASGYQTLAILGAGVSIVPVYMITSRQIIAAERTELLVGILSSTLITQILCYYAFIPSFGQLGAAIGTFAGYIILGVTTLVYLLRNHLVVSTLNARFISGVILMPAWLFLTKLALECLSQSILLTPLMSLLISLGSAILAMFVWKPLSRADSNFLTKVVYPLFPSTKMRRTVRWLIRLLTS